MSEKNSADAPPKPGDGSTALPLSYDQRVTHFAAGYTNSQSVVQFLDTKAAAAIGVVPVVLGILAAVLNWLQESWEWDRIIDATGLPVCVAIGALMLGVALALLIASWGTVAAAFEVICPRDTGTAEPSMLFPYDKALPNEKASFATRAALFATGAATEQDALECYRRQVVRMSEITREKLTNVDAAIRRLRWVFGLSAVALLIMLLLAGTSAMISGCQHSDKKEKPDATPTTQSATASNSGSPNV